MNKEDLFKQIWDKYVTITPDAQKIKSLFESLSENVNNDHIAFRTIDDKRVNIEKVSELLLSLGYKEGGEYKFTEKKLYAKHFYHDDKNTPKVFISQLLLNEFSNSLQTTLTECIDQIGDTNPIDFMTGGRLWSKPSYETYKTLVEESEYAGWFYLYGYVANHFTIDVNELDKFN